MELNSRGVLAVGQILDSADIFVRFIEGGATAVTGERLVPVTKH